MRFSAFTMLVFYDPFAKDSLCHNPNMPTALCVYDGIENTKVFANRLMTLISNASYKIITFRCDSTLHDRVKQSSHPAELENSLTLGKWDNDRKSCKGRLYWKIPKIRQKAHRFRLLCNFCIVRSLEPSIQSTQYRSHYNLVKWLIPFILLQILQL